MIWVKFSKAKIDLKSLYRLQKVTFFGKWTFFFGELDTVFAMFADIFCTKFHPFWDFCNISAKFFFFFFFGFSAVGGGGPLFGQPTGFNNPTQIVTQPAFLTFGGGVSAFRLTELPDH